MTSPAPSWPVWKLSLVLYPFAAGAVAINLFLLSLIGWQFGLPVISPALAVGLSVFLGAPVGVLAGRWFRRLMDEAEKD